MGQRIKAIEDKLLDDIIAKREIDQEAINDIRDQFEKFYPIQEMNVILGKLKNGDI